MTIPNLITTGRLVLVPILIWLLIAESYGAALALFVLAGVSDGVDGYWAKRFNAASRLGAHLDPIADKAMLVGLFLTLGFKGMLPAWLIVLAVSRDVLIVGGVVLAYLLGRPLEMRPITISKLNTVAQIVLVGLVLAVAAGFAFIEPIVWPAILVTAALTAITAAAYLREGLRHMAGNGDGEGAP